IPTGTGRERAEKVDLGEEFEEIARADGRGLHEILPRGTGKTGAHEDVEDVVDVTFRLARGNAGRGGERAGEVRVAAVVILAALAEQVVGVGIAARADHVMHGTAEGVETVPVERVMGDRR